MAGLYLVAAWLIVRKMRSSARSFVDPHTLSEISHRLVHFLAKGFESITAGSFYNY
ncbi:MAG: hypothetical protein H0U99_02650 [Chthoniobacterales bacterium]|nr:hypothetical protein [Chthoniobacterales bacterium]